MIKKKFIAALRKIYYIFKIAINGFIDDKAIKLSASLSYFTIFSLPPLLIIIIYFCGIFFGEDAVRGDIFWQIDGLVGKQAAVQIQEIIKNVKLSENNDFVAIIGVIILLIGASSVFAEMQSSIDHIWSLKAKPKLGFKKFIKNRLLSFSMIGSVVFLLLVCLVINMLLDILSKRLLFVLPNVTRFSYFLNLLIVYGVITLSFTTILKLLPDAKIAWKYAIAGGACSSLLFILGKFAIGLYIGSSSIATIYGAAGSIIVILMWVYYSAIILYFGAEITKAYALSENKTIIPNEFSVRINTDEVELTRK